MAMNIAMAEMMDKEETCWRVRGREQKTEWIRLVTFRHVCQNTLTTNDCSNSLEDDCTSTMVTESIED